MNAASEEAIPIFRPFKFKKRPPLPWWDIEFDKVVFLRRSSLKIIKKTLLCPIVKTKRQFKIKARNI